MSSDQDPVLPLREALALSPENIPLRRHLAATLEQLGRLEEAEAEFREILKRTPRDGTMKLELVRLFRLQGKTSEAAVLVEALIQEGAVAGPAYLEHCRLLLDQNDTARAAREYRKALDEDPELADRDLERILGLPALGTEFDDDSEGRHREPIEGFLPSPTDDDVIIEHSDVDFSSVGGMESVKEQVRMKIIFPLKHPEMFAAYGKKAGGGILLYGPPGCGKTHLARATAGEVGGNFIPVGIHDTVSMWTGESEKRLHALFEAARRNTPCVLFFDEVDALGAKRSDMKTGGTRHLINQFLEEMDGVRFANDGVLILAATNAPWHLDSAFMRPGRFDDVIFVPPPDQDARASILEILCHGKPSAGIDYPALSKKTEGLSGADLKAIIDKTIEEILRVSMKSGKLEPLNTKRLLATAKTLRRSTKDWFATARNYALYSNESGLYDDILRYLEKR